MEKQMKTYETRTNLELHEILEVMANNSRSVEHYRTDIFYDMAEITRLYWSCKEINVTWILRDYGTYLLSKNQENYAITLDTILENYDKLKIYTITYDEYNKFTIKREKNYIKRRSQNDTKRYTHY